MTESGCQKCGENTYSGDGAESCRSCPEGKVSNAGSKSAGDCEYGTFHPNLRNYLERPIRILLEIYTFQELIIVAKCKTCLQPEKTRDYNRIFLPCNSLIFMPMPYRSRVNKGQ